MPPAIPISAEKISSAAYGFDVNVSAYCSAESVYPETSKVAVKRKETVPPTKETINFVLL